MVVFDVFGVVHVMLALLLSLVHSRGGLQLAHGENLYRAAVAAAAASTCDFHA